ncbi:hypothetical protein [Crossiella sp. NPDC003009]
MHRALALVFVLLTSTCATLLPAPAPPTSAEESPSPRLRRALPTEAIMTKSGYRQGIYRDFMETDIAKHGLVRSCERSPSDLRIDHSALIDWTPTDQDGNDLITLDQVVTHYRDGKAADAVTDVKRQLACGSFRDGPYTFPATELSLPALPGVDAQHAACGTEEEGRTACLLVLAKGDLAVASAVEGGSAQAVPAELRRIAPLLATTLANA